MLIILIVLAAIWAVATPLAVRAVKKGTERKNDRLREMSGSHMLDAYARSMGSGHAGYQAPPPMNRQHPETETMCAGQMAAYMAMMAQYEAMRRK